MRTPITAINNWLNRPSFNDNDSIAGNILGNVVGVFLGILLAALRLLPLALLLIIIL